VSIEPASLPPIPEDKVLDLDQDPLLAPPPNIFNVNSLEELRKFGYSLSDKEIAEIEDAGDDSLDELSAMNYAAARIALGNGDFKLFRTATFHCPNHFEEIEDVLGIFHRCISEEIKRERDFPPEKTSRHCALANQAMKKFDIELFKQSISHLEIHSLRRLDSTVVTFQNILKTRPLEKIFA
jgi:hypothetical protein